MTELVIKVHKAAFQGWYNLLCSVMAFPLLILLCTACVPQALPQPSPTPAALPILTAYATRTVQSGAPQLNLATPTLLPTPSPTPRTHVVARGETLGAIALRYGLSVEQLIAANPEVNPNLMVVGTPSKIPASQKAAATTTALPSPTPVAVSVGAVICAKAQSGGGWCLAWVRSPQDQPLESVTGQMRVMGLDGSAVQSAAAQTPLNLIPAGKALPLMAYFSQELPNPYQASVEVLTALPAADSQTRYLAVTWSEQQVQLAPDGLSAQVTGSLSLAKGQPAAKTLSLVLIAIDAQGQVVGVRQWQAAETLEPGAALEVSLDIYSLGAAITQVEGLAEAQPASQTP